LRALVIAAVLVVMIPIFQAGAQVACSGVLLVYARDGDVVQIDVWKLKSL